jgi:hypothetical protein
VFDRVRPGERHALGAARDQHPVESELLAQPGGGGGHVGVGGQRPADRPLGLEDVGRQDGSPRVDGEVGLLGVHQARDAAPPRLLDEHPQQARGERALVVVGQAHDLVVPHRGQGGRRQVRGGALEIDPPAVGVQAQQLVLVRRQDARLGDGAQALRLHEPELQVAELGQALPQPRPVLVPADHAGERDPGPQGGDRGGHVRRPAGAVPLPLEADDRHRRLGGDAPDAAQDVAVEHRVPDDQGPHAAKVGGPGDGNRVLIRGRHWSSP